ncbi:MAG TPA: IgGFc-binding protein, partial [Kofleriaceae bacterium]|nr:IgGFc-binding protein [Kofleriaceae bacterium]
MQPKRSTTWMLLWVALAATPGCGPLAGAAPDGGANDDDGPHGDHPDGPPAADPCDPTALGNSYVGCDYWPTVTGNMVSSSYQFAVVVSNTTATTAQVSVEGGALIAPLAFEVPSHGATVQRLPWVASLKLCTGATYHDCQSAHGTSALASGGAYHLRSTAPVTVYQFNPLDFQVDGAPESSYTNDASLLFPSNTWGTQYYVATRPAIVLEPVHYPSELAVTAVADGTVVTITTRATTRPDGGAPGFTAGVPQQVTLDAGDVLEIGSGEDGADLSGSYVIASKPVQVLGAHFCAQVPVGFGYCDHLEESMLPVAALSNRYMIAAPAVPSLPAGKEETIRVVATEADTTLTYDPLQVAPFTLASPGDFLDIPRTPQSFQITANHKILVAQFMEGSTAAG